MIEMIFGDEQRIRHLTAGVNADGKFFLVLGYKIEEDIDVPYEFHHIDPIKSGNGMYIYRFESVPYLCAVMRWIGFRYISGVSCLDGKFITPEQTQRPLTKVLPNACRFHSLINCSFR